jgi:hypothetical protein
MLRPRLPHSKKDDCLDVGENRNVLCSKSALLKRNSTEQLHKHEKGHKMSQATLEPVIPEEQTRPIQPKGAPTFGRYTEIPTEAADESNSRKATVLSSKLREMEAPLFLDHSRSG